MIVTDKDNQSDPELVEQFTTLFGVLGPQTACDIMTTLAN
jgi:hypothetical protein